MTRVLLIRHGEADQVDVRLLGRTPDIHLTARGRSQARSLGISLRPGAPAALFTSPIERAVETAAEIGAQIGLTLSVLLELNELEFGGWAGKTFEELSALEEWHRFNSARAVTRPPGGESLRDAQMRSVSALRRVASAFPEGIIAAVTHADIIRAVLAASLSISLNEVWRVEIGFASVTAIEVAGRRSRVLIVNGLSGERELGLLPS